MENADCCDGTDEPPHKCYNTCEEAGALEKTALRRKAKAFKVGLKLRSEYVTKAVGKPQRWEEDLESRRREEQALRREVNILRGTHCGSRLCLKTSLTEGLDLPNNRRVEKQMIVKAASPLTT